MKLKLTTLDSPLQVLIIVLWVVYITIKLMCSSKKRVCMEANKQLDFSLMSDCFIKNKIK